MAPSKETSWGKVIALCSSIGIPLLSVVCWLIVQGTHLVDAVNSIAIHQQAQDSDIRGIREDIKSLHNQVDTISLHQHDAQFIYQRQNHLGFYIEKKGNKGELILVPYK